MTTLHELQQELLPWQQHNFPDRDTWEPLVGLSEELGELSHAHLKLHQGIRLQENHTAKAKDAIGDIIVYLADYCNARSFDLQKCLDDAWATVRQRNWRN